MKDQAQRNNNDSMLHNAEHYTRLYNIPHLNSLNSDSPQATQPPHVKVGLRPHQLSVIHKMSALEKDLRKGYSIEGETLFSRFAVLGDSVGVGKSLMVLGHISQMKTSLLNQEQYLNPTSSRNMYSIKTYENRDLSNCPALLVVPHTLFRQWQDYIEGQTTLNAFMIKSKKSLASKDFQKKINTCDLVLISNTLIGSLLELCQNTIWFSRTYIDEADTIHISSTKPFPNTSFVWFITATWQNVLFENDRVWISHGNVQRITSSPEFLTSDASFQSQMVSALVGGRGFFYRYVSRSPLYFKDFFRSQHPFRTHVVIKCRDDYIEQSVSLPPLFTQVIHCEPSIAQRIVSSAISSNIQNLLHAGDIQAALTALGVSTESPITLIQAVTENRMKELDRLQQTYEFKSRIEYSSPQQKEQSLANLKQKITSLQEQIDSIKQRIQNYQKEICAICFDEPNNPTLTPCCSRIFCGGCILMSLTRTPNCPMCRTQIQPKALHSVGNETKQKKKEEPLAVGPPKKIEALLNLIKKNPKDKFLVFSRYENPFRTMQERLELDQIKVETVKGNKDVINNLLQRFDSGDVRVLLLNSNHAGAGLNITAATYVVLWHAMTQEEEKQILGRAYRMGRDKPLQFVKLVHPDELRPEAIL
jgi:SNF2 family DNA or RNA helicase